MSTFIVLVLVRFRLMLWRKRRERLQASGRGTGGALNQLYCSSLRRSARRKRWPQGHPPAISPAAIDRLHAGYTPLTSLRRRALSATLDRSAAIGQRAITISGRAARRGVARRVREPRPRTRTCMKSSVWSDWV
eukprot:COSAG05_NODE_736_length_7639_cov_70.224005_4_plen_134_part_00